MSYLQAKLETIIEDVNQEDGTILTLFEKITDNLFFFVMWGGTPLVIYLLIEVLRW